MPITAEHLSESQLAILQRMTDVGEELVPVFAPGETEHSRELIEAQWASTQNAAPRGEVQALLDADLIEVDWEEDDEFGRVWFLQLTESGERLLSGAADED